VLAARSRLRSSADFTSVVRGPGGSRSGGRLIVVHANPTDNDTRAGGPRVGFVVSKGVGGAVVRNRTKRVLRHLMAPRLPGIPDGCDLVVRANPAAATASTPELATELDRLLAKVLRRRP